MASDEIVINGFVGNEVEFTRGKTEESNLSRFRVASTSRYRNQQGQWQDGQTIWYTCKAWGDLALNIDSSIKKGNKVLLRGRLSLDTWSRTDDFGKTTQRTDLVVTVLNIGLDLTRHVTTARPGSSERPGGSERSGHYESKDNDESSATVVPLPRAVPQLAEEELTATQGDLETSEDESLKEAVPF